ncbi:type IV secretion system protein [Sulfurospirillum arcachonense]|uniref:type IV secretion system protein n=1 Tax=Sulfurospirillum arcachonense TaxID=57666 RepID=UPI00046A24DC|nr:type IV secretion system protein [Sulfurospirillum arcachonense]
MELDIYKFIAGIFHSVTADLTEAFYEAGAGIYNTWFFTSVYTLAIMILGLFIMTKRISNEELAQKAIFGVILLGLVKAIIINPHWYQVVLDLVDLPRVIFSSFVSGAISQVDPNATPSNMINALSTSMLDLLNTIRNYGSWKDWFPYFFSTIFFLSGTFLIFVIIAMILFSSFLAQIVLSLGIIVLPTLIFFRTQHIFFAWAKLYISLSLYAPFTLIFGVLAQKIAEATMFITGNMESNFYDNIVYIIALVIAQLLVALAIFKIPNIINQIIGSANEGSSITSGLGAVSAVGTIMTAFTKFTGVKFASNMAKQGYNAYKNRGNSAPSSIGTGDIRDRIKPTK